jgi:hypothetical protein
MGIEIDKTAKDVRDAERETRTEYGEIMTPAEKAASMARAESEKAKAAVDRAKRKIRDST